MQVELQEESYTSKTCPVCGKRRKSRPEGRNYVCTNKKCRWKGHRDFVGAFNIRAKYRGEFRRPHVVGVAMATPIGLRFAPHAGVARWERVYQREAAGRKPSRRSHYMSILW